MKNLNQLAENSPVLAQRAAPNTSAKYGFINSAEVLHQFETKGWTIDSIQHANVKNPAKNGFQKHLVWLKHAELPKISGLAANNESEIRLCLVNSHDGSTAYNLFLGIMRMACLNQLLTGNIFRYFRAVHSQNIINRLDKGIQYVTDGIPDLVANIQQLQQIQLNLEQRDAIVRQVLPLRFAGVQQLIGFDARIVERAMRPEDKFQDAYTVLNRLQEYLIRGGIPYSYFKSIKDENGNLLEKRIVSTTTRKVAAISTQIKLNEACYKAIKAVV